MKKFYELIVVIPVGPGSNLGFVADTIASFIHYARSTYRIFIMDDSGENAGIELRKRFPDLDIHYTPRSLGHMGGLYINLSVTYRQILERYHFTALLKLDTDALITGRYPEEAALALFGLEPAMGIAGQYPDDYHGRPWDTGWPRRRILNGTATWKFIKRPRANRVLKKLHQQALGNGYVTGESVFGGAYFISEALLVKLNEAGWLPDYRLRSLNLGEDHLFGLLAKAAGFGLGSLSEAGMPFACAWKGLPASPEELWMGGKKIIHSTRGWNGMGEEEIRDFFRKKRGEDAVSEKQETTESLNIRMHE
jgi:hypothetical protein